MIKTLMAASLSAAGAITTQEVLSYEPPLKDDDFAHWGTDATSVFL